MSNKKVSTEFGDFIVSDLSSTLDVLSLISDTGVEIDIAAVSATFNNDGTITKERIFARLVELFIMILRAEVKLAMFGQLPLNNNFKDAVLRMQIENMGQTFEVRKYVDEYDKKYGFRDFPKVADLYELEYEGLKFICPYGLYVMEVMDSKNFRVMRFRDGEWKEISTVYIPYYNETDDIKLMAAMLQCVDTISNDIHDLLNTKKMEMIKRTAEVVKYIFGYDKLRRALRNRATA